MPVVVIGYELLVGLSLSLSLSPSLSYTHTYTHSIITRIHNSSHINLGAIVDFILLVGISVDQTVEDVCTKHFLVSRHKHLSQ